MSILDTFYILFKTDAAEAAKNIKEVDKASDGAEKSVEGLEKAFKKASLRAEELAIAAEHARLAGAANAKALAEEARFAQLDARKLAFELKVLKDRSDNVKTSFVSMGKALVAPLLALASFGALTNIAIERASAIRELDQFSVKLNSSVSDVDAFQRAVKGLGGETAGALDSLVKIGEKINEAFSDEKSGARKDFKEWGLAFKDAKGNALGASEGILELAKNLENVSNAEALARIKKLGIEDAATIDFLMMGRMAVDEHIQAQKRMGVVTEEQAAATRDYYSALGDVQNLLTSIGNRIVGAFLPAATRVIEAFQGLVEWMLRNQTLVQGFFIGVAGVITAAYLPAIVAAATATLVAIAPFVAIAAAIAAVGAAFALAYEDVLAFLNGQPSLIGELAKRYEWFGNIIAGIGEAYQVLKAGAVAVWDMLADRVNKNLQILLNFWSSVEPIWTAFKDALSAIGELLSAIGERVAEDLASAFAKFGERFSEIKAQASEMFAAFLDDIRPVTDAVGVAAAAIRDGFTGAFNAVMEVWNATVGRIAGLITGIAEKIRGLAAGIRGAGEATPTAANDNAASAGSTIGALIRGQNAVAVSSGAAVNGQTAASLPSGATVTNTSNVSVGAVTVNTQATDAKGVAAEVRGELERQLRGTAAQFDDGVDR